jgi:hypothetical protein
LEDLIEDLLEKAFKSSLIIESVPARSQALCRLAEASLQINNPAKSASIYAEALKTADLLKHPDQKSHQLAWLARLIKANGDLVHSAETFKRAYYLARAAETLPLQVSALYYLANEYVDAGMPDECKAILTELLPLVRDPAGEVDTVCEIINIAEIYADLDDQAALKEILFNAVDAAHNLKDLWFKAERLIEIAGLFSGSGYRDEAVALMGEALETIEKIEESGRPYFWMKLADLYIDLNMKDRASDWLLAAKQVVLNSENITSAVGEILELVEKYLKLADHPASLDLLFKAQAFIEKLADDQDRIQRLLRSIELYHILGEDPRAFNLIEKVYQLNLKTLDLKSRIYNLGRLAVLVAGLGRLDRSAIFIDEIVSISSSGKIRTAGLGSIAGEMAASDHFALAFRLVEIIREPEIKAGVLISVVENQIRSQAG